MPRRLVTSEIWANEKFGTLNLIGRLVFIGLITHADDEGRLKGSPNFLKIKIFPYDLNITPPQINEALDTCHKLNLIIRYSVNGDEYIYLCGWKEHQQIRNDRFKKSNLPQPDDYHVTTIGIPSDNQVTTNGIRNIIEYNISKDKLKKGDEKSSPSLEELKQKVKKITDKSPYGEEIKQVFAGLQKRRGYKSPKNAAEAKSIRNMLKDGYKPDQILSIWDRLKSDNFWQDKELFVMTVASQIGAILKAKDNGNGKNKSSNAKDWDEEVNRRIRESSK